MNTTLTKILNEYILLRECGQSMNVIQKHLKFKSTLYPNKMYHQAWWFIVFTPQQEGRGRHISGFEANLVYLKLHGYSVT